MSDSLEQLQIDTQDTIERGLAPDRIVLRAISMGCDTRAAIRTATGLDYAAIEKALEREAGVIRKSTKGMIERLSLVDERNNGHSIPKASLVPALSEKTPPVFAAPKMLTPEERIKAGEMRAQGKTMNQIALALGMSLPTFHTRRKGDPILEAALKRGWEAWEVHTQSSEDEPENSPVGYIEDKSESKAPSKAETERNLETVRRIEQLVEPIAGASVSLEGGLRFNIDVVISANELASWSPLRISNFFDGIAKIMFAGGKVRQ